MLTVHNLAFQGRFPADLLGTLRLPPHAYTIDGVECYGTIGFLKAGLLFADRITTVSPTYAAEIQTPANGDGLDGLLRARSGVLLGVLNGIDVDVWNPATDARIPSRYDQSSIAARQSNKRGLQARFGLGQDPKRLLFAVVSRLAWQKGIDILVAAVPALIDLGAQLVVLGAGEHELEQRLVSIAQKHHGLVGCKIGYDENLAHLIQAGADALVVPSRFEPCGLTQLCALRYGAIPVVAKVGGLADTIVDIDDAAREATGIRFAPVTTDALVAALRRADALWRSRHWWARVQHNGMSADVSWSSSAKRYAQLYAELMRTND